MRNTKCANFAVDRLSFIQQASKALSHVGLDLGVRQSDHRRWRHDLQVRYVSQQMVATQRV